MVTRTVETEGFKFYYINMGQEFSLISVDKNSRKEVEFTGTLKECKEFEALVVNSGI